MKLAERIGCALAGLLLTACGSEMGDPTEGPVMQLALTLTSTDETVAAVRTGDAPVIVEDFWLSMPSLAIVPCADDASPVAERDRLVDLMLEPPAQSAFETSVSDYCAVRFDIAPSPEDDTSLLGTQLHGTAVRVRGTRADGEFFDIRSYVMLTVDLASLSGETFGARELALGFDVATWFDGVDIAGAEMDQGGLVLMDPMTNTDVLAAFEANVARAGAVYIDADRDGALDDDERDPIAVSE